MDYYRIVSGFVVLLQKVVNVLQSVLYTGTTPVVPKGVRLHGPRTVLAHFVTRLRTSVLLYLEYKVDFVRRIIAVDFLLIVLPIPRALSLVRERPPKNLELDYYRIVSRIIALPQKVNSRVVATL